MPNDYKQVGSQKIQLTDAEQVIENARLAVAAQAKAAEDAAEAARLANRPNRSDINAIVTKVGQDNSVAELRATVASLVTMMNQILTFQRVDVNEDA